MTCTMQNVKKLEKSLENDKGEGENRLAFFEREFCSLWVDFGT